MSSKLVLRLVKKIEKDLGIQCNPDSFVRTRVGCNMKEAGAFVWTLRDCNGVKLGSCDTVTECVRSDRKLELVRNTGDNEITAEKIE